MFEQIPLIEITKHLCNADFKSFRLTNKLINTRLIKEYEQRTYSLLNIIKTIDETYITNHLDIDSLLNLARCVPKIPILIFYHKLPQYQPSASVNYSKTRDINIYFS